MRGLPQGQGLERRTRAVRRPASCSGASRAADRRTFAMTIKPALTGEFFFSKGTGPSAGRAEAVYGIPCAGLPGTSPQSADLKIVAYRAIPF